MNELSLTRNRVIPREDVAEVCMLSLKCKEAINRSFDIVSDPVGKGEVFDGNLPALLDTLKSKNSDYSVPDLSFLA